LIVTTENGTIKSDIKDTLLTDGMSYGIEYVLGADRNISEFTEISKDEYEKMLEADAEVIQGGY
jgi:hypothetical protein